jgi:hypothetical protein
MIETNAAYAHELCYSHTGDAPPYELIETILNTYLLEKLKLTPRKRPATVYAQAVDAA